MTEPVSVADLVVTWPKTKPLETYLAELEKAATDGLQINFRVPSRPAPVERCYMVYDGEVRGWNRVLSVEHRGEREVARVESDAFAGFWPAGWYVVRDPVWTPVTPMAMKGFQGYRYLHREAQFELGWRE